MRAAKEFRHQVPSRKEVADRIDAILSGELSRAEVAGWASEYIVYDEPQIYPAVSDPVVFEALEKLMGADLMNAPSEYLHDEQNIKSWLEALRGAA